jgi:hypothetical protein
MNEISHLSKTEHSVHSSWNMYAFSLLFLGDNLRRPVFTTLP